MNVTVAACYFFQVNLCMLCFFVLLNDSYQHICINVFSNISEKKKEWETFFNCNFLYTTFLPDPKTSASILSKLKKKSLHVMVCILTATVMKCALSGNKCVYFGSEVLFHCII